MLPSIMLHLPLKVNTKKRLSLFAFILLHLRTNGFTARLVGYSKVTPLLPRLFQVALPLPNHMI